YARPAHYYRRRRIPCNHTRPVPRWRRLMHHNIPALITRHRPRAALLGLRAATLAACVFTLAACSSNRNETAMQLIQHQQEQQSMLRQHEADVAKKNAPSEPEVAMAMIRESQDQQRY